MGTEAIGNPAQAPRGCDVRARHEWLDRRAERVHNPPMRRNTTACSALVALVVLAPACKKPAPITSTFDADDEGWLVAGDAAGGVKPELGATGGNPGGHIAADDKAVGGVWYFRAPQKFLGNRGGFYGTSLTFDLKQSDEKHAFEAPDVSLRNGAGLTLVIDAGKSPASTWTSFRIKLDESAGWRRKTLKGEPATKQDLKAVLEDLTELRIRGEYRSGKDRGALDNVVFGAP
jgi:hypothetical protein